MQEKSDSLAHYGSLTTFGHLLLPFRPLIPTNEVRVGRTRKGFKGHQVAQGCHVPTSENPSKDAQVLAESLVWIMGGTSDELVLPPF